MGNSPEPGALMDLGEILARDRDVLVQRWLARAKEELPEAEWSHPDELVDELGEFLRAAAESLQGRDGQDAEEPRRCARVHGLDRWRSEWRLASVVRDYQILRRVLVEHLEGAVGHALPAVEQTALHLLLDEAIRESLETYVSHRDAELGEAHRRLQQLVLTVGHEVRSPIGACMHALNLLEDDSVPEDARRSAAGILARQLEHLVHVSEDLSSLSHLWLGRLEIARRRVDLREVLEASIEAIRPRIEAKALSLASWLPMEPIWVEGDPFRLQQVFTNLLTNAAKFTAAGGRIELGVELRPTEVVLRVIDNGVGISRDFLPHVFDLFRRGEKSGGGLGMGLHLARHIVDGHEGRLEAESEGPGKGAEFRVVLPRAAAPVATDAGSRSGEAASPGGGVVLVVDDDEDWVELLRTLLESKGFEVLWAATPEAAVEAIRTRAPRVAILDLLLGGTSGFDLAPKLRAEAPEVRLVAYSGLVEEGLVDRARAAGFDELLPKTIHVDELLAVL